ncbi:flagellar hook-basal body protein [Neobacillus novalis]|uniref:Flagellar hook-basal body protein n=1 Tax=Neobacillus novalis TaxID=220687 RepID=A0AA95MQE0_9BACI|nr:flagellar hook-basal body protein [Neobacillus novalis]WHY88384.1 flagellar hook-basal body protein [Neobacillus novalis]
MLRGIESASSGMIALQRKQDALTNNLANAETPGYKQDSSPLRAFPEMLLEQIHNQSSAPGRKIGSLTMGVYNQETLALFTQGSLVSTNSPFDVAINDSQLAPVLTNNKYLKPSVLFAVQTADGGFHLTRNGNFSVNASGQLTTSSGDLILGQNGAPISDPELASGDVTISDNGDVIIHPNDAARAKTVGSLGMVVVNDPSQLVKEGNGLFTINGGNTAMIAKTMPEGVQLQQKMLEQSNVDIGQTITEMMANIRLYEANQKVLQAYDKTLEQLNTVGRV